MVCFQTFQFILPQWIYFCRIIFLNVAYVLKYYKILAFIHTLRSKYFLFYFIFFQRIALIARQFEWWKFEESKNIFITSETHHFKSFLTKRNCFRETKQSTKLKKKKNMRKIYSIYIHLFFFNHKRIVKYVCMLGYKHRLKLNFPASNSQKYLGIFFRIVEKIHFFDELFSNNYLSKICSKKLSKNIIIAYICYNFFFPAVSTQTNWTEFSH